MGAWYMVFKCLLVDIQNMKVSQGFHFLIDLITFHCYLNVVTHEHSTKFIVFFTGHLTVFRTKFKERNTRAHLTTPL
jgi:hypothetical protein